MSRPVNRSGGACAAQGPLTWCNVHRDRRGARRDLGREPRADAARLTIRGPGVIADAKHGDSIAVNGVCLTVVDVVDGNAFSTTDDRRALQPVRHRRARGRCPGQSRARGRGGAAGSAGTSSRTRRRHRHRPAARSPQDKWEVVRISLPDRAGPLRGREGLDHRRRHLAHRWLRLGAEPGLGNWFEVSLIPTTQALTTLGASPAGTVVNLEVDIIAKYVERLLSRDSASASGFADTVENNT